LGKSTLLDALRAVLFEKYSSKAQSITTLQNDRNKAAPVVELTFELEYGLYTITKRLWKKSTRAFPVPMGGGLKAMLPKTRCETFSILMSPEKPGEAGISWHVERLVGAAGAVV
jgi:hypothetical protein